MATLNETTDAPNSTATTYVVELDDTFRGTLSEDDRDVVRIALTAGTTYEFRLTGRGTGDRLDDPGLNLLDSEFAFLYSNYRTSRDDLDALISYTPDTTGDYYLRLRGRDGESGDYELTVTEGVPASGPNFVSHDVLADQLTDGYWDFWYDQPRRSFDVEPGGTLDVNITALTDIGQQLARWALEAWTNVTGINFQFTDAADAPITFDDVEGGAWASTTRAGNEILSAHVNVTSAALNNNVSALVTYLHEIGHALGLGHPGSYNGTIPTAMFANDSWQSTVMSYFNQRESTHVDASFAYAITPMIVDIIAVQNLYGAPSGIRASDTVYGSNSNVGGYLGEVFANLTGEQSSYPLFGTEPIALTLFDTGGTDTIDFHTDTRAQRVDLREEGISDVFGLRGNLVIARDTVIENYVAGSGNDTVTGNDAANRLEGRGGDDRLIGGVGNDRLIGGAGADTLDGGEGWDIIDYETSTSGVTVDLATGAASGGDAEGDVFSNVEGIAGSRHDDALTGDSGENRLEGRAGDDVLDGGGGDDQVIGGEGNDQLIGGEGADTLDGGAGWDVLDYETSTSGVTVDLAAGAASGGHAEGDVVSNVENIAGSRHDDALTGDSGENVLEGRAGDDALDGGGGNDWLIGGVGNDRLIGGAGGDALDGGAGWDIIDYEASTSGVTVDLATGAASGGHAEGDVVSNVERIAGSRHDDALTGNSGKNLLKGRAGDDRLDGRRGDDRLIGGVGNDRLIGGAGADTLDGGAGWDILDYEASTSGVTVDLATGAVSGGHAEGDVVSNIERIAGSRHDDALTGDSGENLLKGRAGDDRLDGGGGDDRLIGGVGNDRLIGGEGADTLDGGAGWDVLDYETSTSGVTVDLAAGAASGGHAEGDVVSNVEGIVGSRHDDILTGDSGANLLKGRAGDDRLDGGGGDDRLIGGVGNDRLIGGEGADTLDGGAGWDVLDYETSTSGVTVDLATGAASGGDAEGDVFSNVEGIAGSRHDDILTGDSGENFLKGRAGDDRLIGGVGNDRLIGGAGADTLDGGVGWDILDYETSASGVTVDLATGAASGGDAEGDVFSNIERIAGSRHDDALTGDLGENRLEGRAGDDVLDGGGGDDQLIGGVGNDRLIGGAGADTLDGGAGWDVLDYETSTSGVTVDLATGAASGGDAEGDVFSNVEGIVGSRHDDALTGDSGENLLQGRAGDDRLVGRRGDDRLIGGVGDDRLIGGQDDDRLIGGAGADTLIGGSGEDVIDYRASPSGVTINLATGAASGGHAQGDRIAGVEHVIGTEHDDHITGDAGANRLTGGGGDDTLLGGAGRDRFIFEPGNGDDTIQDFTDGEDLIDLIGFDVTGFAELSMRSDDRGVVIDLSGHGGGTILLEGAGMASMDETDFLF